MKKFFHYNRITAYRIGFWFFSVALSAILGGGCIPDDSTPPESNQSDISHLDTGSDLDETERRDGETRAEPGIPDCDSLDPSRCSLPWPSNLYLRSDSSAATGYNLKFGSTSLPSNTEGTYGDPAPYERLDGYGLGTPIMVAFENLDTSNLAGQRQIKQSVAEDEPILLFKVTEEGLQRIPYWTELDSRAKPGNEQMLFVRPAIQLDENARYIVAMRNLTRQDGSKVEAPESFGLLRDGETENTALAHRQERFNAIFDKLKDAGVDISNLTLAWDFHTASCEALHGTMLHIRNRGLELVGENGPEITIDSVKEFSRRENNDENPSDKHVALEIKGTFKVPRFVEKTEHEGSTFWTLPEYGKKQPSHNGWKNSRFWVTIPHKATNQTDDTDSAPTGLVQYGHGLLGSGRRAQADFNTRIAQNHNLIYFGSNLFGMSQYDAGATLAALKDTSNFRFMADRIHQGMLEYLLLARAMRERLPETDVFSQNNIDVDKEQLYYSGISQGGMFGHTYMALSTDVERGHLGVPGNNFSTVLERSIAFERYFPILHDAYPNRLDQLISIAAMSLLWEQTEPVSYLHHIKEEPFPDTPSHDVLLAPAKGDYHVPILTNEITARSDVGIELLKGYGRDVDFVEPVEYPHRGSGIVLYDFGNPWPEPGNQHPESEVGNPHEWPRREALHNEQMVHFFRTGTIKKVCTTFRDREPACD